MIEELKWFLKGDTNIQTLIKNNCNIWNGDAYKAYQRACMYLLELDDLTKKEFIEKIKTDDEFAKSWGELGPIYGNQWRKWSSGVLEDKHLEPIDQIQNLINDLKTNPDSRRLMVNAWNVGELDQMTLPPCHYGFQVYTTEMTLKERAEEWTLSIGKDISYAKRLEHKDLDERKVPRRKISLMWNQRSVDVFLGLPFNIASYALLLKLIADEVNMVPDQLVGNLGDTHLYLNHLDQAKEQLKREPYCLPELEVSNVDILNGNFDYELHGYESHPRIKAPLSN
jgi:thymidylate synthase